MTLVTPVAEIVAIAEKSGSPGLLARHPTWLRQALGAFCEIQNGAPLSAKLFNKEGIGSPVIRIRNVGINRTDTFFEGEFDPEIVVRGGDLLVGMDGDFRISRWKGPDALLNQRVCRLKIDESQCLSSFVELNLQGYLDAIWQETSSVTVKHLSSR